MKGPSFITNHVSCTVESFPLSAAHLRAWPRRFPWVAAFGTGLNLFTLVFTAATVRMQHAGALYTGSCLIADLLRCPRCCLTLLSCWSLLVLEAAGLKCDLTTLAPGQSCSHVAHVDRDSSTSSIHCSCCATRRACATTESVTSL
eukprot:2542985-Pleurochrysis_carterae.AAC.1